MASRSARARAMRTAIAVAAVAAPLAAAGSAQAAIAGASPASTTTLPDLVSATATSATTIQVCYDKALTAAAATDFKLSNYLSGASVLPYTKAINPYAASVDSTNNKCVDLSFAPLPGNATDLGSGTIVTDIGSGATAGTTGATNNNSLPDSVTLASSTTQTGTVGHTAGPDLTSVKNVTPTTTPASNTVLAYTFDQNVDPNTVTAADFKYNAVGDAAGAAATPGVTATVSGNTVTVTFGVATAPTVAYVIAGGAYSANDGVKADEVANQPGSFDVNGASANPTLAAAALNPAAPSTETATGAPAGTFATPQPYSTVTYVFDHAPGSYTAGAAAPGFEVALSDGKDLTDGYVQGVVGNAVTVAFPDLPAVAEYAVAAVVDPAAAGAAAPVTGYTPGAAPIGGNAGALARGYTTGPDVQKVVAEGSNSSGNAQYLVYLDQRVGFENLPNVQLLNASGQVIGTATSSQYPTSPNATTPGQQPVLLTFSNGGFFSSGTGSATQIAFGSVADANGLPTTTGANPAFETYLSTGSYADPNGVSVPQIVSISKSAAHAKGIKTHAKKHAVKRHAVKKHSKKFAR